MKRTLLGLSLICASAGLVATGCSSKSGKGVSEKTGWNYNDPDLGGFHVPKYEGQQTGPGLVPIEGGTFTMGQTEEDLTYARNNMPRTVTVSSFYMDETEVANVHYREYTYWLDRTYGSDYPEVVRRALPDSTAWREALAYNEPLVTYYFRHAAYNFYPVVGVSWYQANEYCKWRSDRVNEMILIKNGIMKKNPNQVNEDIFATETYIADQYLGTPGRRQERDLDPTGAERRNSSYSDGYLLPNYRLPTEAEWEYAALALISNNPSVSNKRRRGEEAITDRKAYPWGDSRSPRAQAGGNRGEYMSNFKRGRGDHMGVAGGLNDNADIPAPVYSFKPNAFGLYNMAGNVSEWVLDVYRPTSHQDVNDFRPFRGNVFTKNVYESDGMLSEKDSLGRLSRVPIDSTDLSGRYDRLYTSADARAIEDGDSLSNVVYDYGATSLINDDSRVIKGGSWNDQSYWLSPGTRRFQQAAHGSNTVGFRCAMDRLGSPDFRPNGGNHFGKSKQKGN